MLKNGGGSLAVGTYLQRGSAPAPPGRDGLQRGWSAQVTLVNNTSGDVLLFIIDHSD